MTRPIRPCTRALPLCLLAAAVVTGGTAGCTDINAAAGHVAGLEFDTMPAPAVIAGDTLRDSLGKAAPLRALAFGASGDLMANAEIQYIALDTGVTIGGGGFVTAQRRSGSVRIVASAGSLQSPARTLIVARRPDSAFVTGQLRDTVDYVPADGPANESTGLVVKVATKDTSGGITTTQGWLVSYQAFFRGAAIAPGDTSVVLLLGDGVQRTGLDTTGSDGTASRRVRVRPIGITQSPTDSVIVMATVRHLGVHVRGSPLRFVIFLRPKLGAAQ